jgi:hypothetical protein
MKTFKVKVHDNEEEFFFSFGKYSNGRLAVKLMSAEDGLPWMTVSHNFPEIPEAEPGYFYSKHWSENRETFLALWRKGIVIPHPKEKESFYFSEHLNSVCSMQFKIADEYLNSDTEEKNMYVPKELKKEDIELKFDYEGDLPF